MKVKEKRDRDQGLGGGYVEVRVRTLDKDETPPEGAEVVPDDTPETDWTREG